jgi:AcrR family transcriptional regulator
MAMDARERILDAAFNMFSKRGYLGSPTREIARLAGVNEVTLFRHFGSKEALFEEVLRRYSFLPKLREMLPDLKALPYRDALIHIGTEFFKELRERKDMIRIILSEITLYPDMLSRVYDNFINEVLQSLGEYFNDLKKRGEFRDLPSPVAARAFLGMCYAFFQTEEIIKGRKLSQRVIRNTINTFADIFINGTAKKGKDK